MDHAEALERIELAAAEPDGIERLMAGDTPEAAAVAGHLAGCPECAGELAAIRRVALAAGEAIRSRPDPALRERTLAYVRAVGRPRGEAAAAGPSREAGPGRPLPAPPAGTTPAPSPGGRVVPLRRPSPWWAAAIAAALVVALGAGFIAGGASRADRSDEVGLLERTTTALLRVEGQPDARRVELVPVGGGSESGSLVFSPASGELVVVATGLTTPQGDGEYGCWLEVAGVRTRIGRMYFAGGLATWVGPVADLAAVPSGARFGVSLGAPGGGDAPAILAGDL